MTIVTSHVRSKCRRPSRLLCVLIGAGAALYAGCDRNPCPSGTQARVHEDRCVERDHDSVREPAFTNPVDDSDDDREATTAPAPTDIDAGDGEWDAGDQPDGQDAKPAEDAESTESPPPPMTTEASVTPRPNDEAGSSPPDDASGDDAGRPEPTDGGMARDAGRTVFTPPASPWQLVAGSASVIAVGANGDVWSLGTTPVSTRGMGVFKRVGETWTEVLSGGAVNIAVDPSGIPWIIDADGNLFNGSDSSAHASWSFFAAPVTDVAFSAVGDIWVLGEDRVAYRYLNGLFDSGNDGFSLAFRLAVTPSGIPWIIDSPERVFERASATPNPPSWIHRHGTGAADISIAPDGTVFVLSDTIGPGGRLAKYLNRDQAWVPLDESVGGRSIAAGPSEVWIVDAQGRIYRHDRAALP